MITKDEIYTKVAAVVADALDLDPDEVTLDSILQADLGAESIDFLDIVFQLEREFNMKIPRGDLFPEPIFQADLDYVNLETNRLTEKGVDLLRERLPFLDLFSFEKDPTTANLSDLFTVGAVCRYICARLEVT